MRPIRRVRDKSADNFSEFGVRFRAVYGVHHVTVAEKFYRGHAVNRVFTRQPIVLISVQHNEQKFSAILVREPYQAWH